MSKSLVRGVICATAVFFLALALTPGVRASNIEGSTSGIFVNSQPPGRVVSGVGTNFFTWGVPAPGSAPSSLLFTGTALEGEFEELLSFGRLTFFNGIVEIDSGAESVRLDVTIMLTMPSGITEVPVTLFLEDTPNTDDPIASADIVRLPENITRIPFMVGSIPFIFEYRGFGTIEGLLL